MWRLLMLSWSYQLLTSASSACTLGQFYYNHACHCDTALGFFPDPSGGCYCKKGYYLTGKTCQKCPFGFTTDAPGQTDFTSCVCDEAAGYFSDGYDGCEFNGDVGMGNCYCAVGPHTSGGTCERCPYGTSSKKGEPIQANICNCTKGLGCECRIDYITIP